ncbi:hypothetical protein DENSPDRAFT_304595 [Dentipellis sp. KUC8613]|nr:hypothetical protein DENSPDRAFT_304595 [Dentipellis sp. KUC8613]
MIRFRFRTFRKFWMSAVAITSLTCILLSIAFNQSFNPKADLCVLIIIPAVCMLLSLFAILSKHIFTSKLPHCVAVECIWTTCIVPFTLILGLFSYGLGSSLAADSAARAPFIALQVFSWLLMALLALYSIVLVVFTFLVAAIVDKDIWFRDISGSPSPFPIPVLLESLRVLFMSGVFGTGTSTETDDKQEDHHCPPGCPCDVKLAPPSSPPALPTIGPRTAGAERMNRTSSGSSVPVRVPTAMERHNTIVIGFDV